MTASRAAVVVLLALLAGAGCTTVHLTATARSSVEQRLVTRALERAVAKLDTTPLAGRVVGVEVFGLTEDRAFAEAFAKARLETRAVRVVRGGETPDIVLRMFFAALAVDSAQTLLGLPAMQTPVLAVPVPEIALFKWERSRGHAEVQVFRYDAAGRLLSPADGALGEAHYNRFTILLFISFSVTDLDQPPEDDGAGRPPR